MPEAPAHRGSAAGTNRLFWSGLAAVLIASAIAYAPSLTNGLTNWDDDGYVLTNPWLGHHSWAAVTSMLVTPYKANYHPLTMLSLWADHWISGGSVAWLHAVNLLLHLANTALAALLVLRLGAGVGVALTAAALFGLHPVHVESVAWVSERKDVLYACFALASLLVYVRAARSEATARRWRLLGLSLLLFVAALLSKGVAVSLAPTLLAIDWLLGRRLRSPSVLIEKLPFFAIALLSGLVTIAAQSAVGQLAGESTWSGLERIALAGSAYVQYIALLVAPVGLSAFHPYPARVDGALPAIYWLGPLLFLAAQGLTLWLMGRARLIAFGLGFFTLNVALLLQLIPVGGALIAERYAYLPALGLFVSGAAAGAALLERRPAWRRPLLAAALVYAVALGAGTWVRTGVWQDSLHLWNDTLARHPDIPVARLNRALARHQIGNLSGALDDLDAALAVDPRYARALAHRGVMRFQAGEVDAAVTDLDRAIVLEPTLDAYLNRGAIRLAGGNPIGALADLERVLAVDPAHPLARANRGLALAATGRHAAALAEFERTLLLAPGYLPARIGRAEARLALGTPDPALAEADEILRDHPGLADAEWLRGRALLERGELRAGCAALHAAAGSGHAAAEALASSRCEPR